MYSIETIIYLILDSYAYLMLTAIGLGIIYGMMGILNFAHGEFIMIGAYITSILFNMGVPFGVCVLCATAGVGLVGGLLDIAVMNRLYGRPLDSIGVTWGISLILQQGVLILFGSRMESVTAPFGSVVIGRSSFQVYRLLLIVLAILLPILLYLLFHKTRFGLNARAAMQRPQSANLLGINTRRIYTGTFVIGSAFAGLAGALLSATLTIAPTMGQTFSMQSFVTIVVGGFDPLVGVFEAAATLGVVRGIVSMLYSTFYGRMAMLAVAVICIRILPRGISGLNEKRRERKMIGRSGKDG